MNEYELLEAIRSAQDSAANGSMDFVAVLFGYIAAAYLVGKDLPRAVAVLVSLLFSGWLVARVLGVYASMNQLLILISRYQHEFPESPLFSADMPQWVPMAIALGPLILAWMASLLFLHIYIRRRTS